MKSNYRSANKLNKFIHIEKVRKNIQTILVNDDNLSYVLTSLFDYMMSKTIYGCCHAFSSVLYIALSELGYNPSIFIGECKHGEMKPFDHSWITINDKIIDIAIYMPLTQKCNSVTGPIILDIDAVSMKHYNTLYGINTGLPFAKDTQMVMNLEFTEYLNNFPFEKNGLWSVLQIVLPDTYHVDIDQLKTKYYGTERILVR